jgi:hypothetical protein
MATVFRIEHSKTGEGPYFSGAWDDPHRLLIRHHGDMCRPDFRWPCPDDDVGIDRMKQTHERCAFTSMRKLRQWFSEHEVRCLCDYGFRIVRHDGVRITARGRRQCLFIGSNPMVLPVPKQTVFLFEEV